MSTEEAEFLRERLDTRDLQIEKLMKHLEESDRRSDRLLDLLESNEKRWLTLAQRNLIEEENKNSLLRTLEDLMKQLAPLFQEYVAKKLGEIRP